jgi:hypothetical protein
MLRKRLQLAVGLSAFALVGAACSGTGSTQADSAETGPLTAAEAGASADATTAESRSPVESGAADTEDLVHGQSSGQEGADEMEVTFLAPDEGAHIVDDDLAIEVRLDDFTLAPALTGKENRTNTGHWLLYLDGSLVDLMHDTKYDLSLVNLEPGDHTLRAVPALNDGTELSDEGQADELTFDWDPNVPPARIVPANFKSEPDVEIVAPSDGAQVRLGESFQIELDVRNFNLSRDLMGKDDVEGYGHWHLNVDNEQGEPGGLLAMGTTETIKVSTEGLDPGVHTFWITLSGNGHAPIDGEVRDSVDIAVK